MAKIKPTKGQQNMMNKINPEVIRPGINYKRGIANVVEGEPKTGMTIFEKKKVTRVFVPAGEKARDRLIRLHETLHANNSPSSAELQKKYGISELACQAVEDAYVHLIYWPMGVSESMNRDSMSVALGDLRAWFSYRDELDDPENYKEYNLALAHALRALCIADTFKRRDKTSDGVRCFEKAWELIGGVFKNPIMASALWRVISLVGDWDWRLYGRKGMQNKMRKLAFEIFEALLKHPKGDELSKTEEVKDEAIEDGKGKQTKEPMKVIELALVDPTDNENPQSNPSRSGSRIVVSRLPHVLSTRNLLGLFEREQYVPHGGTVLIDASGSMGVNDRILTELCKMAPGAMVAFYNGIGQREDGSYGDLVIFAKDGLRASEIPKEIDVGQGNEIDRFALEWLLEQKGPLTFVTDENFGGGPANQGMIAKAILDANRNRITTQRSIKLAMEAFSEVK